MTYSEERIYNSFIVWLLKRYTRDVEDIHQISFTTQECKDLYNAILEDKS
jgi:hypothetical protein